MPRFSQFSFLYLCTLVYLLLLCPPISFATEKDDTKRLKISIYNEANFHGEVWPAFAYTLLESGHDVDVYAMDSAQRMSDVSYELQPNSILSPFFLSKHRIPYNRLSRLGFLATK